MIDIHTPTNSGNDKLSPEECELLWAVEDLQLSPLQADLLPEVQKWLDKRKENPLADLLLGKPTKPFSDDLTQKLTADVLARFRPQKTGIAALQLLGKMIDRGNERGLFVLCPPPSPVLITRKSSPFAIDRWPLLDTASALRDLLAKSIINPKTICRTKTPPHLVAQVALGQILVSSIVHGGLINTGSLIALAEQMHQKNQLLQCLGNRVFVELSLGWRKQDNAEFRRWFPDELSAVLIMNFSGEVAKLVIDEAGETTSAFSKQHIWRSIQCYLKHAGAEKWQYPNTLTRFLDAVRLDLETEIPIVLVDYAARSFVSHSLKPSVWQRLHGLKVNFGLDSSAQSQSTFLPGNGLTADVDDTEDLEPRWMRPLREAIRGENRNEIITRIEQLPVNFQDGFSHNEAGELFAGFAIRMFSTSNGNKVKLSIRTARAYTISAAKRIGELLGTEHLEKFGPDEWIGIYEEVISDADTPGKRRKIVRLLREFQRYLELDRNADQIDAAEVFGSANDLVPVDANLISHDEFLRIRKKFAQGVAAELHPDLAEIGWIILTISYRCGLRRMEVLKLELEDLLIKAPPELLVRPTEARSLKTKSSTRKIPLYALLDEDELKHISAWMEKRQKDEVNAPYSTFLFAAPTRNFVFVPQDTMFKLLHRVMREETGDPTLRFHHLRHAFASRCFVTLAASMFKDPTRLIADLPGFSNVLENAKTFRQTLFGNIQMTRRDVWAVSSLLGHSGPDVSMEHYIHLFDLCLAERLSKQTLAPRTGVIVAATGKSPVQAHRHREGDGLHSWIAHLWRKRYPDAYSANCNRLSDGDAGKNDASEALESPEKNSADSLLNIWKILLIYETKGMSAAEISLSQGVSVEKIECYIANAKWLHGLKLSEKHDSFRHRFRTWTPDKRYPSKTTRICCPIKPHESRDQKIVESLLPKLREALKADSHLATRVMKHYALNSRPNYAGMIFTDPKTPLAAQEFMKLLLLLGLLKKNIRFVFFDVTSKRSKISAAWKDALGLRSSDVIDKIAPLNGRKDWACPWIGIEPIFIDETGGFSGAAAFRFLIVMAIIAIRIPQDENT